VWRYHGRPVQPDDIPVDRLHIPALLVAGGADTTWPPAASVQTIAQRLGDTPHQVLIYPAAGHQVGTFPYAAAPGDAAAWADG
jgi:dienelactone hydrolase